MLSNKNVKISNKQTLNHLEYELNTTHGAFEYLKLELTPRNSKNLHINVDYDDEEKLVMKSFSSFSPLNRSRKADILSLAKAKTEGYFKSHAFSKYYNKFQVKDEAVAELQASNNNSSLENNCEELKEDINIGLYSMKAASSASLEDRLLYSEDDQFLEELCSEYMKLGVSMPDNCLGNYDTYLNHSLKLIYKLPSIDYFKQEINKRKYTINLTPGKRLMILDLDETLIHTDFDYKFSKHDAYLNFTTQDNMESILPLILRPNLIDFLEYSIMHFDIAIFTASCQEYADTITKFLDPEKKYFKHVLSRDWCVAYKNLHLKFIEIFNIDLKDCIIIDNSLFSFAYNLSNGILVTSFYNDMDDEDLKSLIDLIQKVLLEASDCRIAIESTFEFTKLKESLKTLSFEEVLTNTYHKNSIN